MTQNAPMMGSRKTTASVASKGSDVGARPESTVERIVVDIRNAIRDGTYVPGQRLIEADIIHSSGASRGPIREALRRLAADGFITIEHHRGARVKQMGRDEVAAQYEVREVIEGLAARLAAQRINQPRIRARLQHLWRQMDQAAERKEVAKYTECNQALHALIVELSGNPHLPALAAQLSAPIFRLQFRAFPNAAQLKRAHLEHRAVVEAILAGDPAAAERAIRRHIRRAAKTMHRLPDSWWPPQERTAPR